MGCMQSTPVNEPVAAAPASNKSAQGSAPSSQNAAVEPEAEATPVSAQDQKYKIGGMSITDAGVVYYVVEAVDGSVSVKHRYNDFKALYAALGQTSGLPALPEAGVHTLFRGKHSQELIKEREAQFTLILNAIAAKPALHESPAFQKFLA